MKNMILLPLLSFGAILSMEQPRSPQRGQKRRPIAEITEPVAKAPAVEAKTAFELLPDEIKTHILTFLTTAHGATKRARLDNAAENIRSFFRMSSSFKHLGDDPRLIEYLITELANRYADGDKLAAAIALGTEAAGKWLKNLADKWRTMNPEERAIFRRMQYHFINAAADGRDNVIKFLLTFFPRYAYNWSKALKAALENGHTKVVREILFAPSTQGIRQRLANLKTADDGTFLIDAIHKGNDAMADILLDAGVDVNVKDIYGITALALAAENQKVNIIKKILARGVRPEILNLVNADTGETPLTTVINKKGSLEIIKALVKAGAIVTQKNEDDETPVQVAQRSGADKAVIEFLTYGEI